LVLETGIFLTVAAKERAVVFFSRAACAFTILLRSAHARLKILPDGWSARSLL
jgi:hypothetical protein